MHEPPPHRSSPNAGRAESLAAPEEELLFCGMAIGYKDEADPANAMRSTRAPLADFATFRGL